MSEPSEQSSSSPSPFEGVKNILLILDCSYSMKETFRARGPTATRTNAPAQTKFDRAKEIVAEILRALPLRFNFAMRVYGSKAMEECHDTVLLCPFEPLDNKLRRTIPQRIESIQPGGVSPLAYTLQQALDSDISNLEGPTVLLLISDGADTCGGNPAKLIDKHTSNAPIVSVSLCTKKQNQEIVLRQLAALTGGKVYSAASTTELIADIRHSLKAEK